MNTVTIHTLTALPLHNLNRDESGAPKQITEGGVTRARLSSQSIKRAARIAFERSLAETDRSTRSKVQIADLTAQAISVATDRGIEVTPQTEKKLAKAIGDIVLRLTQSAKKEAAKAVKVPTAKADPTPAAEAAEPASDKKDTLVWLSAGERHTLVLRAIDKVLVGGADTLDGDAVAQSTDSLAIAAFGRMFAAAPSLTMEAAVSVGNATTTHEASIELDYFTAVDDIAAAANESGAGQLGYQMYTSGVYYQAITIDRAQLLRNLDGDLDDPRLIQQLNDLVRQLVIALPQGKKSGTNPFAMPSVVLVEEQSYRSAYQFQTPVQADEDGGYLEGSVTALAAKVRNARGFDATAFGDTIVTGVDADLYDGPGDRGTLQDATVRIVEWIRAGR